MEGWTSGFIWLETGTESWDRGFDLWFHLVGDWHCTRIEVWTSGFILLELGLYQDRGLDLWFHLVVILTHTFVQNHVFA